jgi:hypothetical protein
MCDACAVCMLCGVLLLTVVEHGCGCRMLLLAAQSRARPARMTGSPTAEPCTVHVTSLPRQECHGPLHACCCVHPLHMSFPLAPGVPNHGLSGPCVKQCDVMCITCVTSSMCMSSNEASRCCVRLSQKCTSPWPPAATKLSLTLNAYSSWWCAW